MNILIFLLAAGCQPRDSGRERTKDSPVDTGTIDSQLDTGESGHSAETAETAETGDSAETADTDTGVDTAPPPCDRSLGWRYVACGKYQTCGIHTDGCAECWGRGEEEDTGGYDTGGRYHWYGEDQPPDGVFVHLAMNAAPVKPETPNVCGILDNGAAVCWGRTDYGVNDVPDGEFISVEVWEYGAYGLRPEGGVEEWGYGDPPVGSFTQMATGKYHAVFLQPDGQLYQTAKAATDEESSPPGTFVDIGMGEWYGCAISTAGYILCWDPDDPDNAEYEDLTVNAPVGAWVDVCNLGGGLACALDDVGAAVCWDSDDAKWDPPSDDAFTHIACGWAHGCGVTIDNRIECWGSDHYGETIPPT